MTTWASFMLTGEPWWPSHHLSQPSFWFGRKDLPLNRLGDIAKVLSVGMPLTPGLPLVTPADVNAQTGAVAPSSATGHGDALLLGQNLRPHDVLVPRRGNGPCVLVSEELEGIAFASFLVIRPVSADSLSLSLWALLSSETGAAMRATERVGSVLSRSFSAASIAELTVPTLPVATASMLQSLLPRPQLALSLPLPDSRSRWQFRDLRRVPHWTYTPDVTEDSGTPLRTLGGLRVGHVDKKECFAAPGPERLPVLLPSMVRGHSSAEKLWAARRDESLTTAATVVFTRNAPFRVVRAPTGHLLAKDLLALDVAESSARTGDDIAAGCAAYLSSAEGRRKLAGAASGGTIPYLTVSSLSRVRIQILDTVSRPRETFDTLAKRLDRALSRLFSQ